MVLLTGSAKASTSACGRGIIIDLKEGGWNEDGIAIRLSGNLSQGSIPATLKSGSNGAMFVWFRTDSIGQSRVDGIRRSAALAFAMGTEVWTSSHVGDCSNATELSVLGQ